MLIYNAMRVAAILHIRLLIYDGYDKFDWETCDPDAENPVAPTPDEMPDDFDATEGAVAGGESSAPGVLSQHHLGSQENHFHSARVTIGR